MSEVKRGALQSPADTTRTADTVVRHVQNIDAAGNVVGGGSTPFDHESITVAATAIGCTSATYLDATRAEMTLETAQVRKWAAGTAPTATVGQIVEIGDTLVLNSAAQIAAFKAILAC
jgi:hypothetical protein